MSGASVEFCGEVYPVSADDPFVIGRDADLCVDDNPYLHRRFLSLSGDGSLWWLTNIGSVLTATVADRDGQFQAWLAPGGRLPLVFAHTVVWFTAGPTTYDLEVKVDSPPFHHPEAEDADDDAGATTVGRVPLTPDQKLLLVALAEPLLRRGERTGVALPATVSAAARLGWTVTKFNRKLDNVCDKLSQRGVRGLHGGPDQLATNRRARLVEYALSTRLVTPADIDLLPTS